MNEKKRLKRVSRRGFIFGSAAFSVAARGGFGLAKGSGSGRRLLLVGTQTSGTSKGIYSYLFDPATGELGNAALAAAAANPTFLALAPNGRTVLVANELDTFGAKSSGAVSSYTLDRANSRLIKVNEVASLGGGPCHVAFDHTGRSAFAANYGGGSAASFSVGEDGRLSAAVSFFQYTGQGPDQQRQKGPHAHRVTVSPDNRFLLVNDLGLDAIHVYRLDAGTAKLTLNDPPAWRSSPGAGPRALQFHPNGRFAYVVNELNSTVSVLSFDSKRGVLHPLQTLSTLPEGFIGKNDSAELEVHPNGKFVYASNRGHDSIAVFAVDAQHGTLALVENVPTQGKTPRSFEIDPTGTRLFVANQDSDDIVVFRLNSRTGHLNASGDVLKVPSPVCIRFVMAESL